MALRFDMLREFPVGNPVALREALQRFEGNVRALVEQLKLTLEKPLVLGEVITAQSPRGTLIHGVLNRVDSTSGNVEMFLPQVSRGVLRELVVAKLTSANTLTLRCVTGTVNGAGTLVISAAGARRIYCDGEAYYA